MHKLHKAVRGLAVLTLSILVAACSSIDLPTVEQSERRIGDLRERIASGDATLDLYAKRYGQQTDGSVSLRSDVLNRLFGALASARSDDVVVGFPPTRPLLQEKKSILGIRYTNRLDIDSGRVAVNLKEARLLAVRGDELRVLLDMEGSGRIAVSGTYTGISASSSPRIELSLRDTVAFRVRTAKDGQLLLEPRRKLVQLLATLHVSLLGWEIPWTEEIPLQVTDIIDPVCLPSMIATEIKLPVPATTYGDRNYEFVAHPVEFLNTRVRLGAERLTWQFDCVFR
ncbi:hypothetical protein KQI65_16830 [bacterium]|nr:hypothetical protein [bacterium]